METKVEKYLPYASLSRRALALILDSIILIIPCAVAGHILPFIGSFLVVFFYYPILESSDLRATLGKYLAGIQVSDPMGRRISLKAAIIRNLMKCISLGILFIGFIIALFTEKKQTLHDLVADTLVVYGRNDRSVWECWIENVKEIFGSNPTAGMSSISQLERLQRLRESGTLTEEEFQKEKAKILN